MVQSFFIFATRTEGDHWLGLCPSLRVSSIGDTEQEALRAVGEAVDLWLESCEERGTLIDALSELGFAPVDGPPFMHDLVRVENQIYCRPPDYLPRNIIEQLIRMLGEAAGQAADADEADEQETFHYQPHRPHELHV